MVEVFNNSNDNFVVEKSSTSSNFIDEKEYLKLEKRIKDLKSTLLDKDLENVVDIISDPFGGVSLKSKKDFYIGETVFEESPLMAYTSNGFCIFCRSYHPVHREDGIDEFEISDKNELYENEPLEKPSEFKPPCDYYSKYEKSVLKIKNFIQIDEKNIFSSFDIRKIQLIVQYLFLLYHASTDSLGESSENAFAHARLLNKIFRLHSECSCESLKEEEKRYVASEKIKNLVPRKYSNMINQEKVSEIMSIIDTNSFEVNVSREWRGCGLYLASSMANHSCASNCGFMFKGDGLKLQLIAKEEIKAGQEITISYDSYAETIEDRFNRVLYLSQNYGFLCRCIKCSK